MINRCMQCDGEYEGDDLGGLCPRCLPQQKKTPGSTVKPDLPEPASSGENRVRGIARNISMVCSCGREFFVPATARGNARCPQCRSLIPIAPSGKALPLPPPAPEAAAPAPKGNNRTLLVLIGTGAGVLAILLAILIVVLTRGSEEASPRRDRSRERAREKTTAEGPAAQAAPAVIVKSPGAEPSAAPPAAEPAAPAISQKDLDRAIARANMTGLVSTLMILTGRSVEHDELHARLLEDEKRIKEMLDLKLPRPLKAEGAYFQSGDRLYWFSGRRLDPQNPKPFAEFLASWLRTFQPGAKVQGDVQRGATPVSITFYFPERSEELLQVLKAAEKAPPPPPPPPEAAPLPADLLAEVKSRLDSLHPCYRKCFPPEDEKRMAALLAAGKGTADDVNFLRDRILSEICREFAEEYAGFSIKFKDAESKAIETASSDIVIFKDGRKIEGSIEEETEEQIKIKSRLGSVRCPKADVLRIERGKAAGVEFRTRYEAARGNPAALANLIGWCKERRLGPQKDLCCYALLLADPGHSGARTEIGLSPSPGSAAPEIQVNAKEGKIEWNGTLYTPEELNRRLTAQGYVQIGGLWYEKLVRTFRIDNLYRDEKKLIIHPAGASVMVLAEEKEESTYDLRTRSYLKSTKLVPISRFIGTSGLRVGTAALTPTDAGTGETGTCYIEIQAPGDILECRLKAVSQVMFTGGYVSVSIASFIGDTNLKVLYTLNTPGTNDSTFDITDKVRGAQRFFIRAELRKSGMFLPGDTKASGLLDIRYAYGKPLERLNAVLGAKKPEAPRPTPGAPVDNDMTEKAVAMAAESAYMQSIQPLELMNEVRRLTGPLRFSRDLPIPPRFVPIVSVIPDPLSTRFEELAPTAIQEIIRNWELMAIPDRRDFLRFFGLWCARTRYLRDQQIERQP